MAERKEYEMSEDELAELLDACKSVPCMMIGDYVPRTPQENANLAWQALGSKLGFDYLTVEPIPGTCQRHFSAVPVLADGQR
jgi:hypothetical protein